MNIGSDFIGEVTDFIKELQDTGELKYILEKSPELLKASLDYELQKLKTLEKMSALYDPAIVFMKFMTRMLEDMANLADTVTGKDKLNKDNINVGKFIGKTLIPGGNLVVSAIDGFNLVKNGFNSVKNWFGGNKNNDDSQNVRKYNGYTAEAIINSANNIAPKDKETVKEIIEHDGKNEYNINVTAGASSEEIAKQLVDAIRNIQNNR